jgi:hypothetical protein
VHQTAGQIPRMLCSGGEEITNRHLQKRRAKMTGNTARKTNKTYKKDQKQKKTKKDLKKI